MRISARILPLFIYAFGIAKPALAQVPFYRDDPSVTDRGKWHFEFFNEIDALQHPQYPTLRQNTANFKLNYGLPGNLEFDIEAPYLALFRAVPYESSMGAGDAGLGIKWNFRSELRGSHLPALGASFYVEFPTGDHRQELGSGLTDYWLNFITQTSLSEKTRINGNIGFVFAGNTSTGALGIQTTRGHVLSGGLSFLRDIGRLTLGGEIYGGTTANQKLDRSQLQGMLGGRYGLRNKAMTLHFGLIIGKYAAGPRIGGQFGFSFDLPDLLQPMTRPRGLVR